MQQQFCRFRNKQINSVSAKTSYGVIQGKPGKNGEDSKVTLINQNNKNLRVVSNGGDGSLAHGIVGRGVYTVLSHTNLTFDSPSDFAKKNLNEADRHAGGQGGFGDGLDKQNRSASQINCQSIIFGEEPKSQQSTFCKCSSEK